MSDHFSVEFEVESLDSDDYSDEETSLSGDDQVHTPTYTHIYIYIYTHTHTHITVQKFGVTKTIACFHENSLFSVVLT